MYLQVSIRKGIEISQYLNPISGMPYQRVYLGLVGPVDVSGVEVVVSVAPVRFTQLCRQGF